jgi:hypothetical protein
MQVQKVLSISMLLAWGCQGGGAAADSDPDVAIVVDDDDDGWPNPIDCDDADPAVNPDATETGCNTTDEDCDGTALLDGVAVVGDEAFTSIQSALDAAQPGDVVKICPGVHEVELSVASKFGVTIQGWDPLERAILDGGGEHQILFADGGALSIESVDFRGGWAATGGCVQASRTSLELRDVHMSGCVASGSGGALHAWDGDQGVHLVIRDSTFEDNRAASGGALVARPSAEGLLVERSVFRNNMVEGDAGGAMSLTAPPATEIAVDVVDSAFDANSVAVGSGSGGAIFAYAMEGHLSLSVRGSTFNGNAARGGGAIAALDGSWGGFDLRIEQSRFDGNEAETGAAIELGCWLGHPVSAAISGSEFIGNVDHGDGGAVHALCSSAGGDVEVLVEGSWFEGNTIDSAGSNSLGAALRIDSGDADPRLDVQVTDTTFIGNTAPSCSALFVVSRGNVESQATFTDVLVDGNIATDAAGNAACVPIPSVWAGSSFVRNDSGGGALLVLYNVGWTASLDDVAFGTGGEENSWDIHQCDVAHVGTVDDATLSLSSPCP